MVQENPSWKHTIERPPWWPWIVWDPPGPIMDLLDREKKVELIVRHLDMQIKQLNIFMGQLKEQSEYLEMQKEMLQ